METEMPNVSHQPSIYQRLLSAGVPVLLIAVSYVDPGKWATIVEGGARFGFDMATVILVLNFAAILCQNLSANIAIVTGRDLSQICSEEYDKTTCIILGIQTEVSVFLYDLNMILGSAHVLNLILGVDLLTCVFLMTLDAFLFPLFSTLQDNCKIKMVCTCVASSILLSYICGVLISQPEIPISMTGMLTKLSGENAFSLMSLLGANIIPHNFYLHSSIVQQDLGPLNVSKGALCQDHFLATLCIFSCISVVNYVLMNSAANVFYSTGLGLLTFQDALSLMDQVFRSPAASFAFLLVLFFSSHITALTWNLGRQAVLRDFFRIDIPGWLHHATIRLLAIVPAIYCVWSSGAEGIYQMLIFTQVMVALVLPSSVIPLFRVASSRSIMGVYKISQFVEFLGLIMFIGMLSVEIIFVVEMIFGNSDWVGNLRWSMGSSAVIPYAVLLTTASASLCLMLWLATTPLKSASSRSDAQVWTEDIQNVVQESHVEKQERDFTERIYQDEHSMQNQEPPLALEKSLGSQSATAIKDRILNFPETLLDSARRMPDLAIIEESCSNKTFPSSALCHSEESATTIKMVEVSTVSEEVTEGNSLDNRILKTESTDLVEKNVRFEGDSQTGKDDEGEIWDHEESSKGAPRSSLSMTSDGPGSFRSLSGKSEDAGSGAGSLSRLAGLGRAARRQLAAALDEFWGQMYDLHGQAAQESKTKKQDVLLGSEAKVGMLKENPSVKKFSSLGGRGSDSVVNSMLYDTPKQQQGLQRGVETSYEFQTGLPSPWSNRMHLLGASAQNFRNTPDYGERSYSSLRLPPSSDSYSNQPVTVHGYQLASYLSQIAKEKNSDFTDSQKESSLNPNSPLYSTSKYRDPPGFPSVQNPPNRLSTDKTLGIPNRDVSRNSLLQPETPFHDVHSSAPTEKKYCSLPDISGLLPQRDSYLSGRSTLGDSRIGYGPSVSQKMHQTSLYSSPSTRTGTPFAFDEISPSKVCRDAFSLQFASSLDTRSLWSRQPFEQFGVAAKTHAVGSEGIRSERHSVTEEANSAVDLETKLLKSFRHCILKLLKLEGSDWLFRQNDGADEDLIDRVAARERFLYEAETKEINRMALMGELPYSPERKPDFVTKMDDMEYSKFLISSVPNCGEGCIWELDLIISFGVWCIHRILELSLMESRPELWGKYTYVLNRLQGVIDPAFSKPRSPMVPCFCLQIPVARQQRSSPPPVISNGSLPPPARQSRTKCTTAAMLLDMVKDVEIAISCRKGRTGTAAGDVAFPKGKENLASVLKRYKRRLSSKLTGSAQDGGGAWAGAAAAAGGMRKVTAASAYG